MFFHVWGFWLSIYAIISEFMRIEAFVILPGQKSLFQHCNVCSSRVWFWTSAHRHSMQLAIGGGSLLPSTNFRSVSFIIAKTCRLMCKIAGALELYPFRALPSDDYKWYEKIKLTVILLLITWGSLVRACEDSLRSREQREIATSPIL